MEYNSLLKHLSHTRKNASLQTVRKEAPRGMNQMPKPNNDISIATIIEHTPSDKDVKEYFKKRVSQLVERQEEKEKEND